MAKQKIDYSQQVKESREADILARRQRLKSQAQEVRRYNHAQQYLNAEREETKQEPKPRQPRQAPRPRQTPRTFTFARGNLLFIEQSRAQSIACKKRFLAAFEELKQRGEYIRVCEIIQMAELAHSYLYQKDSPVACELRQMLDDWNAQHKFKKRTQAECLELFNEAFEKLKQEGKKIRFYQLHREMKVGSKWIHSHPDLKRKIEEWNKSL